MLISDLIKDLKHELKQLEFDIRTEIDQSISALKQNKLDLKSGVKYIDVPSNNSLTDSVIRREHVRDFIRDLEQAADHTLVEAEKRALAIKTTKHAAAPPPPLSPSLPPFALGLNLGGPCSHCGGGGKIKLSKGTTNDGVKFVKAICPTCNGTGKH